MICAFIVLFVKFSLSNIRDYDDKQWFLENKGSKGSYCIYLRIHDHFPNISSSRKKWHKELFVRAVFLNKSNV